MLHFLGWNRPWIELVADWLWAEPDLLRRRLVVVPTRESGRRLRELLVEKAVQDGAGAILGPRLATPDDFFRPEVRLPDAARWAGWSKVLREASDESVAAIFPSGVSGKDDSWRFGVARQIEQARELLTSVNADFAAVARLLPEEADRWRALAGLERQVVSLWKDWGFADPAIAKRDRAQNPIVPPGVEEVVVGAVPDPTALALTAWGRLAEQGMRVTVLIGAPEALRGAFDEWGRPKPEFWTDRNQHVSPEAGKVLVAADAAGLAEAVTQACADRTNRELAIGLCDATFLPAVKRRLEEAGWITYDPQGTPLAKDGAPELFEALASALEAPEDYGAVARVARHPAVWRAWLKDHGARAAFAALETWEERECACNAQLALDHLAEEKSGGLPAAEQLLRRVRDFLREVGSGNPGLLEQQLREWLGADAPDLLELVLSEMEAWKQLDAGAFSLPLGLRWLAASVSAITQGTAAAEAALALQGWLELAYEPAPHLVLAAMHEGKVPEAPAASPLISEAVRERLGLRDRKSLLAREVFLYTAMVEARRARGSVTLVTAQVDPEGDPCKPSQVLLQAKPEDLPKRVRSLIRDKPDALPLATPAWGRGEWRLRPPRGVQHNKVWKHLSPSTLKAYLDCPTRFYFSEVLGWEEFIALEQELDGAGFGNLIHKVLGDWGQDPKARDYADEEKLRTDWLSRLKREVGTRFGKDLPPLLRLQVMSAEERLLALAARQAEERSSGWSVIEAEKKLDDVLHFAGLPLKMRVDRIDRHEDGRVRVIDYKTARGGDTPRKTHLRTWPEALRPQALGPFVEYKGRSYGWADLQLPLYARAVQQDRKLPSLPSAFYVLLPEAVGDVGFVEFEGFEGVVDCAMEWAQEAARRIGVGVFWPPAPEVKYDLFEAIAPDGLQKALGEEWAGWLSGARERGQGAVISNQLSVISNRGEGELV
jgi:ATP-dependent helicase/nuclease subunit B